MKGLHLSSLPVFGALPAYRSYYVGSVDDKTNIQMELEFRPNIKRRDNYFVYGTSRYPQSDVVRYLERREDKNKKLTLLETDCEWRRVGQFQGVFAPEAKKFEGAWTGAGGESESFSVVKVAEHGRALVRQSGIEIEAAFPVIVAGTKSMAAKFADLQEETLNWVKVELRRGQKEKDKEYLRVNIDYFIKYYSKNLVSLLGTINKSTSEHHVKLEYVTKTLWARENSAKWIRLADLFKPGSDYVTIISDPLKKRLGKKGARYVRNGTIEKFQQKHLTSFAVTATGIRFFFAPKVVGTYMDGPFNAEVSYGELKEAITPNGPAGTFVKPRT